MSKRCPYAGEARITARRRRCSRSRRVTTVSGSGCSSPSCSSARPSSVPGWHSGRTVAVRRARPPHRSRRSSPASSVSRFRPRSRTCTRRVSGPTSSRFRAPSRPAGRGAAPESGRSHRRRLGGAIERLDDAVERWDRRPRSETARVPRRRVDGPGRSWPEGQRCTQGTPPHRPRHRRPACPKHDLPKNSVVSQSPAPGTAARRGDHVLVTVSSGGGKRHGGRHREANEENEDRG